MWLKAHTPGFLKSFLLIHWYVCVHVCVCACLCVCVSTPKGINNLWSNVGHVWLVKPILQLFSLLLSINWMGMALVTQCIMNARHRYWSWHSTSHRRRYINYLVVATRWSTSVIKVSGQMCSDKFKRWLGFSFTVIVLAKITFYHC